MSKLQPHFFASAAPKIALVALLAMGLSACDKPTPVERDAATYNLVSLDDANKDIGTYVIPQDTAIVDEHNADEIFYGKRLLNETKRLLPDNVGASMNCNSCHIAQGKIPLGDAYINSFNFYPKVMPRAGKEVDLEARINGCF